MNNVKQMIYESVKRAIDENKMKRNFVKLVSEEVIRRLNEDENSVDM